MKGRPLAPALAAEALGQELGTPVDVVARAIWPSPKLPSLVERWMDEEEPDLVLMRSRPYAFLYESVPLRIERALGPVGKPVARAGLKAADSPLLAHNAAFHALRTLGLRTIGGVTTYTPQEVVAVLEACVRVIIRSGFAADGFPIYGPYGYTHGNDGSITEVAASYQIRNGTRPDVPGGVYDGTYVADYEYVSGLGELDGSNGRFAATPEHPDGTSHYVLTAAYPFIPRSFRGTPDGSFSKQATGGGTGGPPPRS